jgi:hypothetical protein
MKMTQRELYHLIFLSEVVLSGNKIHLMEDTMRCLLYMIKSIEEIELSDAVSNRIVELTQTIETVLKEENTRIKEINSLLDSPFRDYR